MTGPPGATVDNMQHPDGQANRPHVLLGPAQDIQQQEKSGSDANRSAAAFTRDRQRCFCLSKNRRGTHLANLMEVGHRVWRALRRAPLM